MLSVTEIAVNSLNHSKLWCHAATEISAKFKVFKFTLNIYARLLLKTAVNSTQQFEFNVSFKLLLNYSSFWCYLATSAKLP